jgi:hypothetical protein
MNCVNAINSIDGTNSACIFAAERLVCTTNHANHLPVQTARHQIMKEPV